jgi:hypothetical protein
MGAHAINAVADRVRQKAMGRYGLEDLLTPKRLP